MAIHDVFIWCFQQCTPYYVYDTHTIKMKIRFQVKDLRDIIHYLLFSLPKKLRNSFLDHLYSIDYNLTNTV